MSDFSPSLIIYTIVHGFVSVVSKSRNYLVDAIVRSFKRLPLHLHITIVRANSKRHNLRKYLPSAFSYSSKPCFDILKKPFSRIGGDEAALNTSETKSYLVQKGTTVVYGTRISHQTASAEVEDIVYMHNEHKAQIKGERTFGKLGQEFEDEDNNLLLTLSSVLCIIIAGSECYCR